MADDVQKFIRDIKEQVGDAGPSVILDVGSRELIDSMAMAAAFPNCRILAFEPNPEQYNACKSASDANPTIEFFPFACGDKEDTIDFYIVYGNCGASSPLEPIHIPGDWGWKKTVVPVRRLDNVLKELGIEKVDVVWMDVQGYELNALKGLGSYIDNIQIMHTEAAGKPYYVGHTDKPELEKWIEDKGFNIIWEPHVGHLYDEGDLLCLRK
jgi:FkbM family methyltransferase